MDDVGTQPRKSAERCKAGCRIGDFLTNDHQLPWIVGGPAVTAPPAALPPQCPEAARIDLVLELGGCAGIWAVEVKKNLTPKLREDFIRRWKTCNRIMPSSFTPDRYLKSQNVTVLSLRELAQELARLDTGTV